MKIIEMPTTISAPKCLRPLLLEEEAEQEESSEQATSGTNGITQNIKTTQPSSETKQGQSKLVAALFIHNEGPLQAESDNSTKADWQVLQCSALYPLWDYRKRVRTDLGFDENFQSNVENEEKISASIMNGFCAHLTKINHLTPEIVFDVTAHWLAEPKDQICIHLKCVQQRKQVGPRILEYLCQFLPKILRNEMNDTKCDK